MRPQLYYSGETLNIGLRWSDLEKEAVDVTDADDIRVLLIHRPMKHLIATYSKVEGSMTVEEDKCFVTVDSETTKKLNGLYDVLVEINVGGVIQKAMSDVAIHFVKPNN